MICQNDPGIQSDAILLDGFFQDISHQYTLGIRAQKSLTVHDAGCDEVAGIVFVDVRWMKFSSFHVSC